MWMEEEADLSRTEKQMLEDEAKEVKTDHISSNPQQVHEQVVPKPQDQAQNIKVQQNPMILPFGALA